MSQKIEVFYEATPNPHAMKFNVAAKIANESAFFDDPVKTARSPLAQKLFGFPWAKAVMIAPTAVTITKQEWVDWTVLADPLSDLIAEHLDRGESVLFDAAEFAKIAREYETDGDHDHGHDHSHDASEGDEASHIHPDDSADVKKIKQVLNEVVRPAVARDGGDIVFNRYENGRLFLHMRGACSGCPSSAMTLKEGIEVRMKEAIPGLVEVIAV